MIRGIHHVGLSVACLERSIEFYRDLVGMDVVIQAPFEGKLYETILGLAGAAGRAALLKFKGTDTGIELFEFQCPSPMRGDPNRPVCDHGITHFCMVVADLEREYSRLKSAGVRFHCGPCNFPGSGNQATYGRDPDGNVFELLEAVEIPP